MCFITCILLLIWFIKLIAIYKAIRWISRKGVCYKKHIIVNQPTNQSDYYSAFEKCGGIFFPFGVKDFKLHSYSKNRPLISFFYKFLFQFSKLTCITCIYLFVSVSLNRLEFINILMQDDLYLCVLSFIVLIGNILLSIESICSYAIFGSYARDFHMLSSQEDNESPLLLELKVFFERFIGTISSGSLAFYVGYVLFNAFTGKLAQYQPSNPLNWFQILFQCIYFASTTFFTVGYGDISPNNELGQLIALILMLQSFLLIVVVFASLISIKVE